MGIIALVRDRCFCAQAEAIVIVVLGENIYRTNGSKGL